MCSLLVSVASNGPGYQPRGGRLDELDERAEPDGDPVVGGAEAPMSRARGPWSTGLRAFLLPADVLQVRRRADGATPRGGTQAPLVDPSASEASGRLPACILRAVMNRGRHRVTE